MKQIQNWLSNPKRKYSDGLAYFNRFAAQKQKETFGAFLNDVKENETINQFDQAGRFQVLINQVLFVEKRLKASPELYLEAKSDDATAPVNIPDDTISGIPEDFIDERDRLKEIIPIMARLHAEIANETIADDKRLLIVRDLVKLDDERRAIWNKIDSAGVEVEKTEEEKIVENSMMALGAKTALRIGQLKGYITRNQDGLEKHIKAGNQKKADNARDKIAAYVKELEELQKILPEDDK